MLIDYTLHGHVPRLEVSCRVFHFGIMQFPKPIQWNNVTLSLNVDGDSWKIELNSSNWYPGRFLVTKSVEQCFI